MNFNRVVQQQFNIVQTQHNQIQASPIRYDTGINKIAKVVNQGYYIQNGNVQTFFTPIKSIDQRVVPHINMTPGPTNAAQTAQMSPFQSYNSKFTAAKGVQDTNSSFSQNNITSYIDQAQHYPNFGSISPNIKLDLNNQVPQPPKIQQQSKKIFEDCSFSSKQRLRSNQSTIIDNDTSLGNISQRGNLRNSSFIRRSDNKDMLQQEMQIQQEVNSVFVNGGGSIKRNSSHETKVRTLAMVQNQNQSQVNRNEIQTLKRNSTFEKPNQASFGNRSSFGNIQSVSDPKLNIIRQTDLIPQFNQDQYQRQILQKNNLNQNSKNMLISNHTNNTLTHTNNSSSSLFILNTSQDISQTKQFTLSNYQSTEQTASQNLQQNSRQNQQFNKQQTQTQQQQQYSKQQQNDQDNSQQQQSKSQNQLQIQEQQYDYNNDKRDFISPTLNSHKYAQKQEIFSFENSQINIDNQFETPIELNSNQEINNSSNNLQILQNNDELNFFSTNQNNDFEILGYTIQNKDQNQEEQNSQTFKLEEYNYGTFEGIRSELQNNCLKEEQASQQINKVEQASPNRVNELIAQNDMLRSNLKQLKEIYCSQSVNIGRIQNLQQENSELKVKIAKLQLLNEEYEKIITPESKINTQNTQQDCNSVGSVGESKSQVILLEQVKELQEKNEQMSKEKLTILELLFNQEKIHNTLTSEQQKQQSQSDKLKLSQINLNANQDHLNKFLEIEDKVKQMQQTIDKLKQEVIEKDNLVKQLQFDLKDSQQQLGLYSDQIMTLKEKQNQKEDNTRQVNIDQEQMTLQTQNKNVMSVNSSMSKQHEMTDQVKKINDSSFIKEVQFQRMQLSNFLEKNNENNLKVKPQTGQPVLLQKGINNKIPMTYYKQNHDKFISNNEYYSIKNQNQILFTGNSIKKLSDQKTDQSKCDLLSCQFSNKK